MRARQQALVAELTLRNLAADDLHGLMDDAVTLVARTLELELSFIAELLPGGEALSWRAAFGWSKDAIARAAPSPASARSLVGYTLLADRPVVSEDVRADERFQHSSLFAEQDPAAAVAVVIPGESQRYGVLVAASRQTRVFTAGDVDFMQAVANVIGVAVERERITERMGEVRESERRRVARELHDEGLRELTDALGLATIARSSATDPAEVQRWAAVTVALQRVGQQLRSAVYDLRLGSHEELPFAELLGDMVEIQSAVALHCEVQLIGQASLPSGSLGHRGAEVLRILREAITNACRHSGATIVQVSAGRSTSDRLRLDVTDDGDWPDRDATVSGRLTAGIIGMYERADELGAELRIERGRGGGTTVSLDLPLGGA
jgi:signal transduction histidine kinase